MTEIPTNQKNMERHMKAVESDRIVTTDGITAERIEEEEDEY